MKGTMHERPVQYKPCHANLPRRSAFNVLLTAGRFCDLSEAR